MPMDTDMSPEALARENEELRARVREAEETLRAIRHGEIDAVVVSGSEDKKVFMLEGADHAYRVMVEQMNESAGTLRTDGLVLFCNTNFFVLLESPAERVRGSFFQDFVSPGDQKLFASLLEQAVKDRAKGEVLLTAASGRQIPVLLSLSIMRPGGTPSLSMLITDLSEQKEAETLRRTAKRLAEAQRIAQIGDWAWDPETNTVTWSEQMFEILGMAPSAPVPDYAGQLALYHPESAQRLNEAVTQALACGGGYELELKRTRPDGSQVVLLVRAMTEQDEQGRPHFLYGSVQDITKRKQAEEALQRSEERYRSLFMSQLDAFALHEIILDDSGNPVDYRFLAVNPAFEEFTGLAADKVLGRTVTELMPDIEPHWIETYGKVALEGGSLQLEDYSTDLGRHFEVHAYCPERGQFAVVFRDVTRMVNDSVALTRAKEASDAANKAKSEFLANMSHEIRTPLNGILGMLQLLGTTEQTEEQKEYIHTAIRSSKRLTSLLSDILDLSRIEAGKMTLQESKFELLCLKEAVLDLLGMEAKNKGLSLTFDLDERLLGVLVGDEVRIRQVLLNLVGNAIKFTHQGEIRVEAVALSKLFEDRQRVLFIVHDTGPGITDDQLGFIFEPFIQGEETYVRHYQGAGLGLAIVVRIVRLMGGELAIENEPGQGTSIYVSIPFRLPSLSILPSSTPRRFTTQDSRGLRILCVDDDSVTRLTIWKLLEKAGHHVSVAVDGVEALNILEKGVFDIILMDIQMPEMDGVEATQAIRFKDRFEAVRDIPIIAMTAFSMAGDKEEFLGAGMNDYISKPVDIEALKAVIGRVMSKVQDNARHL